MSFHSGLPDMNLTKSDKTFISNISPILRVDASPRHMNSTQNITGNQTHLVSHVIDEVSDEPGTDVEGETPRMRELDPLSLTNDNNNPFFNFGGKVSEARPATVEYQPGPVPYLQNFKEDNFISRNPHYEENPSESTTNEGYIPNLLGLGAGLNGLNFKNDIRSQDFIDESLKDVGDDEDLPAQDDSNPRPDLIQEFNNHLKTKNTASSRDPVRMNGNFSITKNYNE